MKRGYLILTIAVQVITLAGCVPATMVPTVQARPGPGKSPIDFSNDNTTCSAQANQQVAGARNTANAQIVGSILTTDPNTTAAAATSNTASVQQQFDTAYSACMYARGETVPGYAVEMQPIANPHRTTSKPKPTTGASNASFAEPPPSSSAPNGNGSFAEPPPSAPASSGFSEPPPQR